MFLIIYVCKVSQKLLVNAWNIHDPCLHERLAFNENLDCCAREKQPRNIQMMKSCAIYHQILSGIFLLTIFLVP